MPHWSWQHVLFQNYLYLSWFIYRYTHCGSWAERKWPPQEADMSWSLTERLMIGWLSFLRRWWRYTHILVDHTHSQRRMSGKRAMHVSLSVSDKLEQSGKTRPCCVIINWHMNMCMGPGLFHGRGWGLCTCTSLCTRQYTTTWIRRAPQLLAQSLPQRHWTVLEACAAHVPIIAPSSLFKVYIRCLNMYINSCCVLLFICPWVNYPFLYGCNMLPAWELFTPDLLSIVSTISAARFLHHLPQ